VRKNIAGINPSATTVTSPHVPTFGRLSEIV
jgi:hypothetical protein